MKENPKILILRFSSIGDIVLTTPVVRVLKTQLNAEIHYCTKPGFQKIIQPNPYVDKVHTLTGSLGDLIKELKEEKFDYIVDLHNNLRTRIIKFRMRDIPAYSYYKANIERFLLTKFKIDKMPKNHVVDRYMSAATPLGVKSDDLGLDYFIPPEDEVDIVNDLPETHHQEYVAVVIGGAHATKRLPYHKLVELCDKIAKPIVLIGGPDDVDVANKIEKFFERNEASEPYEEKLKELGKKTVIFNACGKYNLNQSASLARQSLVVFAHDTGLMHISAALKKTIYSIWGNTVPAFGFYPYKTKFIVFENNKIDCRPCSKMGFKKCPKGHFKCMEDQVFDFYLP
ncbi:glycosyltransferase family 9 protein [Marinigracilibium pacificum]|uniref:Glycosyltransferase family 9 protein n=1 Tax=Marinigracilibium pacificum TaxID=2729599 RepID=A0A848J0Y7_9BACT|nr:glycosyltransferase family 9 protein [Marinigracilibium pacificum]NMM49476.1 glycosyltransferase family 9 protein [Marinigracilibium pacificum]